MGVDIYVESPNTPEYTCAYLNSPEYTHLRLKDGKRICPHMFTYN